MDGIYDKLIPPTRSLRSPSSSQGSLKEILEYVFGFDVNVTDRGEMDGEEFEGLVLEGLGRCGYCDARDLLCKVRGGEERSEERQLERMKAGALPSCITNSPPHTRFARALPLAGGQGRGGKRLWED